MRQLAIALMTVMLTCHGASAGFVRNYEAWLGLDEKSRVSYIFGLVDRAIEHHYEGEVSYLTASRLGMTRCILSQGLSGDMIAAAVTQHYVTYAQDAPVPPVIVFDQVMHNMCLDSINAERAKLGLGAWPFLKGAIRDG
jgi:hypothetical protein